VALGAFFVVGAVFLDGFALDLGSVNFTKPRYLIFVGLWAMFGGAATVLIALGLSQRSPLPALFRTATAYWLGISDRQFLVWTCLAAVAIPLLLREYVLERAPLADDESLYRFAAQLLASGRLWVSSPPLKLFFDQNMMINDGRLYPLYFLGWPALLAIGVWVNAPGIVNPILSALTVPPLLRILQHFVGYDWARAGILLFLAAPFLQIAAATQLSHTSCLMALTWALFYYLRTRDPSASPAQHVGFGFALAFAFCIRPQSIVAIGLPLAIAWSVGMATLPSPRRWRAAIAFLIPVALLAALFLASLWAQNGSPWRSGYTRYAQYIVENGFRFSTFSEKNASLGLGLGGVARGWRGARIWAALVHEAFGVVRLSADLFGWPLPFMLMLVALSGLTRLTCLLWGMVGSYLFMMLFQGDWGIDTFGPVHAFELSLPILILTLVGLKNLGAWLEKRAAAERRLLPPPLFAPSLLVALIATSWVGFAPVRLTAVHQIAAHINMALQAPERAGLHRAVVFAPFPFAKPCNGTPKHFVWFRPANDPDLQNDVLWVNHVSLEDDRRLVDRLPDRRGYVLTWSARCDVTLRPLSRLEPEDLTPMNGSSRPGA
jgi:hypothetical protein